MKPEYPISNINIVIMPIKFTYLNLITDKDALTAIGK